MSTIRDSFPLNAGRVDTGRVQGNSERELLARQVNTVLEHQETLVQSVPSGDSNEKALRNASLQSAPALSEPVVQRDGNHLIKDSSEGASQVHEEVWFTPKLDLSEAEYPAEAQDRTFLTRYVMTPDLDKGVLNVEKTQETLLGAPMDPAWNLSQPPAPEPASGFLGNLFRF